MKTLKELNSKKRLTDYQDEYGLIGNRYIRKDGSIYIDPGDALQRTSYLAIAQALTFEKGKQQVWSQYDKDKFYDSKQQFKDRLESHHLGRGYYVRHRFSDPWAGRLDVTSNDQIRPLIIALGLFGMKRELLQLARALFLHGGFYWNTRETGAAPTVLWKVPDWSGPEHWGLFLRGLGPVWCTLLLPFLLLGDLVGLFGTLLAIWPYSYEKIKNADQLNRVAILTLGLARYPTPLTRLSHYIFKKYRPVYRALAEDMVTETFTYRTRYFQDYGPKDVKPNVADYINETYFWNYQDPNLHSVWYHVTTKYWSTK